jgi:arabinogalactan endo-1,4-beta-galactosidase
MRPVLIIAVLSCLAAPARAGQPLLGADVSSLPCVEAGGGAFGGDDALAVLHDNGVGLARIRLWHTPADGRSGLAEAVALAGRARQLGMPVLLDLHYSDTWADPGRQSPPAAWAACPPGALADSVRAYTRDVLRAFAAAGAPPAWVQLGNEISAGLLWPAGRVGGAEDVPERWDQLARLLQAAQAGIDEAGPARARPRVMLHTDRGGDPAAAVRLLRELSNRGVPFDLVGVSYYPWWHGSLDDLRATLGALAAAFGRPVVVVETAYPWTLGWADDEHNPVGREDQLLPAYPATPAGQQAFLREVLAIVAGVPGGLGAAVCWWEPAWLAAPGCPSAWENLTLFDGDGRPLPALLEH